MTDSETAVRNTLQEAESVAVLTGAGISAESGVPTFRGRDGLWKNYSPEQLATPEAFERDPALVWRWYDWRRQVIAEAQPNEGHRALARLEEQLTKRRNRPEAFTLITQNVDGLHDRAGSRRILKLHGDIWMTRCAGCGREERNDKTPLEELPPRCSCGSFFRPGVVWFGEPLPAAEWEQSAEASRRAGVFLVVGTSGMVYPAAGLVSIASRAGSKIVVVNPETTVFDSIASWVLRGQSGDILRRLV